MTELVHVKGLSELQKFLDQLPAKLEANILRGSLRAGAQVLAEQARENVPVGPPSGQGARRYNLYAGALRDSIRVSVRVRRGTVSARVIAGGVSKKTGANVWYAHLVEYTGAKAHTIKAPKGKALVIGGALYSRASHPGMRARPFMRPALDARWQDAVIAVGNYIKKRLATKQGLDTADIAVEVGT